MKRWLILMLAAALCLSVPALADTCTCPCAAPAAGEEASALTGHAATVYDAVRYNTVLPKDAQVIFATEYICKVYDHPVKLLLIRASQSEFMVNHFGTCSEILLVDLVTGDVYDYTTLTFPESQDVATQQDALNLVYAHFDSYLMNGGDIIMTDSEISLPLSDADVQSINAALTACFTR